MYLLIGVLCNNNRSHLTRRWFNWSDVTLCSVTAWSHNRYGQDKIVKSCSCLRCEHNWREDKTVLSCLDPVSNFQVFRSSQCIWDWTVANWKLDRDKTRLSCLVASCVHTANTDKTRQFCLVRVGGVNKLLATATACFIPPSLNPFNASCSKLLLFKGSSAMLV